MGRQVTHQLTQKQRDKAVSLVKAAIKQGFAKSEIAKHCGFNNCDVSEMLGGYRVDSTVYKAALDRLPMKGAKDE